MSNTPVGPPDPYHYRVEPAEKEAKARDDVRRSPDWKREGELAFFSSLLRLLQRVAGSLDPSSKRGISGELGERLKVDLLHWKDSLEQIQRDEGITEVAFIEKVSEEWGRLMEDAFQLGRKGNFAESFLSFFGEVERYPREEVHGMGYYLERKPGASWLPAPLLDLLKGLARQHKELREASTLSLWISRVEGLLSLLSS